MKFRAVILSVPLSVFLLAGCSNEPPPKIDALQFPVVILFGNAATLLCKEPSQLTKMHSNYLVLNQETPFLIDSAFRIYSMDRLRSVHNSLWMIAHPSGATEVTFELKAVKAGREPAREFFARQLEKQTWVHDQEARRRSLATEPSLLGMLMIVERENP